MENNEFKLSEPISYDNHGSTAETDTLYLSPPMAKDKASVFKLRSHFALAMADVAEKFAKMGGDRESADEADMDGNSIIQAFYMSGADMIEVHKDFKTLIITPGVCRFGELAMDKNLYDKVSANDLDRLLGEYIASFFASSWMDG